MSNMRAGLGLHTKYSQLCALLAGFERHPTPSPLPPAGAGPAGALAPWPCTFACWTAVQSTAGGQPLSPSPLLLLPLQVLAPLVRRLMALRTRLLDNDRAAKKRLDLAVEHLK